MVSLPQINGEEVCSGCHSLALTHALAMAPSCVCGGEMALTTQIRISVEKTGLVMPADFFGS
jgi:hypothetical protein